MTLTIMCKCYIEGRQIVFIFIFSSASYIVSSEAYSGKFEFCHCHSVVYAIKNENASKLSCGANSAACQ